MPSYKVHYFDARGRAEIIRLVLTYAGQEFTDNRLTSEEWAKFKPSTPLGQMPVLEVDGEMFGQTTAIANFLARELGLYGKTSRDALQVDTVVCIIADFLNAVIKVMFEKDEAKKAELQKKLKEEESPKFLGQLEGLLKKSGTGYFVGSDVTLADLTVYDFVSGLESRVEGALSGSPLVKAHTERVGSIPKIKAYVDARKVTPF